MKKYYFIVTALICSLVANAQYTLTIDDVDFDATTGTITDYDYRGHQNIIIPDNFEGIEIKAIGNSAFRRESIQSITIPNTVTDIGKYALELNQLTNISIPNSVTSIGSFAFKNNLLTDIVIPNSVRIVGYGAFNFNRVTTINEETSSGFVYARNADGTEDQTTIVSYCGTATVVDFIPSTVTKLDKYAFKGNQLTNVIIPNSVTTIGTGVFADNKLTGVTISNSVVTISENAFAGNQLTRVTIPNSATTIEYEAFDNNKLSSLTIPNSVTTIGDLAFASNRLTSLTIPNSVTSIGESAFLDNELTNITISNSVATIGDHAFASNLLTDVIIPNSVTNIGKGAFIYNQITEIALPTQRDGYVLEWKNSEETVVVKITDFNNIYSNTATAIDYTITYNTNGGTHSNPDKYNIESATITLGEANKTGDTFAGWYNNAGFTGHAITEITTGSFGNMELWAKYGISTAIDKKNVNSFNVYPNPATQQIVVSDAIGETVSIYSLTGKLVRQVQSISSNQSITVSDLPKGIYLVKVKEESIKLVVK